VEIAHTGQCVANSSGDDQQDRQRPLRVEIAVDELSGHKRCAQRTGGDGKSKDPTDLSTRETRAAAFDGSLKVVGLVKHPEAPHAILQEQHGRQAEGSMGSILWLQRRRDRSGPA